MPFPPEFREDHAGYISLIIDEMLPAIAQEKVAEYCDIFCEQNYFDAEDSGRILTSAKQLGLKLRMHVDQLTNGGGAKLAAELGAITADHLEQTAADGISALAKAGVQPVLLPGSVYALGSKKYPDARANDRRRPRCGFGDRFQSGFLAERVDADDAFTGRHANANEPGRSDHSSDNQCRCEFGSRRYRSDRWSSGKLANFAIYDCEDYRELAYWFGVSLIRDVFVRGVSVS